MSLPTTGYFDDAFDLLKGKKILSVGWTEDVLRFYLEKETVVFEAYGDCCSHSYIESLDNPEIFKDSILDSVESVEGEESRRDDCDVLRWTFYKFKTNKGMCTLSFRNESNGYYSGYLRPERKK